MRRSPMPPAPQPLRRHTQGSADGALMLMLMPMLRKDMQCPAAVMLMLLVDEVLARLAAGAMVFHPVLLRVMKEMAVVEMAVVMTLPATLLHFQSAL